MLQGVVYALSMVTHLVVNGKNISMSLAMTTMTILSAEGGRRQGDLGQDYPGFLLSKHLGKYC